MQPSNILVAILLTFIMH